ncbi:MAG: hypothetical protein PVH70_05515 [Desulfobacterales bacterium]|jgi:hypothetical protein
MGYWDSLYFLDLFLSKNTDFATRHPEAMQKCKAAALLNPG